MLYTLKKYTFFLLLFSCLPYSKCIRKSSNYYLQNKTYFGFSYLVLVFNILSIQWIDHWSQISIFSFRESADSDLCAGQKINQTVLEIPQPSWDKCGYPWRPTSYTFPGCFFISLLVYVPQWSLFEISIVINPIPRGAGPLWPGRP